MAEKPWVKPQLISLTRIQPQELVLVTCKHTEAQPVGPVTQDDTCILDASIVGCLECQVPLIS